jgi:hypothetical protein
MSDYEPKLPHTSTGRLVALTQYTLLSAIDRLNRAGVYPSRYVAVKGRPHHGYAALRSLVARGLVHDLGPITPRDASRLVVTDAGRLEVAYWREQAARLFMEEAG